MNYKLSTLNSQLIIEAFVRAKKASDARRRYLDERDFVRARRAGDALVARVFELAVLIGAHGNEYWLEALVCDCANAKEFFNELNKKKTK